MSDLSAFLLARITEDEDAARAIQPPGRPLEGGWSRWLTVGSRGSIGDGSGSVVAYRVEQVESARHIARHDPARVLAECDAKRRIIELHRPLRDIDPDPTYTEGLDACNICGPGDDWSVQEWGAADLARVVAGCETLRLLAVPFADHPDYDETWRP